jgi:hypothetical protein
MQSPLAGFRPFCLREQEPVRSRPFSEDAIKQKTAAPDPRSGGYNSVNYRAVLTATKVSP